MGTKARVTADKIEDIWAYYQKGYSDCRIAELLNVSTITVLRCRKAMERASRGQRCEYEGLWRDSHYIADYANQAFRQTIEEQNIDTRTTLTAEVRQLTEVVRALVQILQDKL